MRASKKLKSGDDEGYRLWARIVETYSKCALTDTKDKLIALAGIAKHMSLLLKDEYVVGMWHRYLASELLWLVNDPFNANRPACRPSEYRAPSFSWASIDGVVQPGYSSDKDLLIEVLTVELQHVTADVTGLVQSGSLLLKCQLQKLSMRRNTRTDNSFIMTVNGTEAGKDEAFLGNPTVYPDERESNFNPEAVDQSTLYCVPATYTRYSLYVLLLHCVDAPGGVYRRFGLASCDTFRNIAVLRNPPADPTAFPAVAFENGLHTIRLI